MSDFYRMFSSYYRTIFPLSSDKKNFFHTLVINRRLNTALDLGCGAGDLTEFLNELGCETVGIDLSPDLLEIARQGHGRYILADLADYLNNPPQPRDLVICIGNTLPHLNASRLHQVIVRLPLWLNQGGLLLVQTVNYEKILKHRPAGLPTIEKQESGISFSRKYIYTESGSIDFTAILDSPRGSYHSSVTLWPLTAQEFKKHLPRTMQIEAEYGSFSALPYDPERSPAWVCLARKGTT